MKKLILCLVLLAALTVPAAVQAGVELGISADRDGLKSFHLAIGEHYGVKQDQVVYVKERRIPDEDIPVVLFLAQHAEVKPGVIIDLRLGGKSWREIAVRYRLQPDLFYVPLDNPGPPYGKAWGHAKNKKAKEREQVRFSDEEITAYVNLQFVSQRYGYSADEIAKLRSDGKSFVDIHAQVKQKSKEKAKARAAQSDSSDKNKGNGKKKKK